MYVDIVLHVLGVPEVVLVAAVHLPSERRSRWSDLMQYHKCAYSTFDPWQGDSDHEVRRVSVAAPTAAQQSGKQFSKRVSCDRINYVSQRYRNFSTRHEEECTH